MAPGLRTAAAAWLLWPRNKASLPPGGVPPVPDAFAHFGPGSWIVPPAEVVGPENIEIGADVVVLEHSVLHALPGARLQIGNRTILARGVRVMCTSTVVLQGSVSTSDYVVINDGVVVEEGAYLGCGAVLSPGVTIGRRAYVGEGAVVTRDVAAHTVVYGDPAVPIRHYDAAAEAWVGNRLP